jgi:chromosomal replication initiation ATPase DnaA
MSIFEKPVKCNCNKPDCYFCWLKSRIYSTSEIEARNKSDLPSIDDVIRSTSVASNISISDLTGQSRKEEYKVLRQVACYVARVYAKERLKPIGEAVNRHHTTIIYACTTVEDMLHIKDRQYVDLLDKILQKLGIVEK